MSGEAQPPAPESRALPLVAGRPGNTGVWVFAAGLVLVAALLFYALEARRNALSSPDVGLPTDSGGGRISSPPELVIPSYREAEPDYAFVLPPQPAATPAPDFTIPYSPPVRPVTRPLSPPDEVYVEPEAPRPIVRPPARRFEPQPFTPAASADPALAGPSETERKYLVRFDNPSTTIPAGTVIHAVLETALDSTRPGAVRAIVSRDVASFDGSRVLIPKGSRLIGKYEEGIARGQKRALVQWTRLMLPEGVIMELDSPSADPLGRAGVQGKVNSHFFARFGDALMRSILDVGVQVAGRKAGGDTVILNLPNSTQIAGAPSQDIQPTLKVKHGTSVSVFVAHDLDFSRRPGAAR